MSKNDLRDVLKMVKQQLSTSVSTACGLFWADSLDAEQTDPNESNENENVNNPPVARYAVQEPREKPICRYAIGD